jgi:isopenicillin N synthase-like dioxygenase
MGQDRKEFFHLYPWGQVPSEVSDAALRYRRLAIATGETLLRWIDDQTPAGVAHQFSMPLHRMLEGGEGDTLLRIIRYPPSHDASHRSGVHRDTNLLTLLPAADGGGLQVCSANGAWIDVPNEPETLTVTSGVMLEMVSGGYYPSALHRVAAPGPSSVATPRLAMPLFLHPADSVVLSHDQTAADYLRDRARERAGTSRPTL